MRTRTKILLVIALAVFVSSGLCVESIWMRGTSESPVFQNVTFAPTVAVTEAYLKKLYAIDNETFFQNKLLKNPSIDLLEEHDMASTMCHENGSCELKFNLRYVAAPRVAMFTMLHEQCHIKTWGKDLDTLGQEIAHGKLWRSCMLQLDMQGAFREIIIDNYSEGL